MACLVHNCLLGQLFFGQVVQINLFLVVPAQGIGIGSGIIRNIEHFVRQIHIAQFVHAVFKVTGSDRRRRTGCQHRQAHACCKSQRYCAPGNFRESLHVPFLLYPLLSSSYSHRRSVCPGAFAKKNRLSPYQYHIFTQKSIFSDIFETKVQTNGFCAACHARHSSSFCALGSCLRAYSRRMAARRSAHFST